MVIVNECRQPSWQRFSNITITRIYYENFVFYFFLSFFLFNLFSFFAVFSVVTENTLHFIYVDIFIHQIYVNIEAIIQKREIWKILIFLKKCKIYFLYRVFVVNYCVVCLHKICIFEHLKRLWSAVVIINS